MPSFESYRQRIGYATGAFFLGTATGGSAGASSTLVDGDDIVATSRAVNEMLEDYWLLRPDAAAAGDRVRSVATYTPSTGTFAVDRNYTNTPVSTDQYELHGLIEPWTLMLDLVNQALKRILLPFEFTLTISSTTAKRQSLAGQTWLTDRRWVRQVGLLESGETRADTDPYETRAVHGEVVRDGATLYLFHPRRSFSTTTTLYVKAMRSAYTLCRASGAGAYGDQSGLSAEAHQAIPVEEWVAAAAVNDFWLREAKARTGNARDEALKNAAEMAAWFTRETNLHYEEEPLTFFPLRTWGPRR